MKLFLSSLAVLATVASSSWKVEAFAVGSTTSSPLARYHDVPRPAFVSSVQQKRSSGTVIYMGWGPDPIWSKCAVTSNAPACPSSSCVCISVKMPDDVAAEYKVAGQYVQVRPEGDDDAKPIFLAIASPPTASADEAAGPSSTTFEFLIKKTENNDWITNIPPSTCVDVSQVLGNGFPTAENMEGFKYDFPTQNVLFFATGSGIAPIRAAIESGQMGVNPPGQGGRTARLYYGVSTPEDMPYADKFAQWELAGFEIVPVVSRPEETGAEWFGRTGYVQNALEEDGVAVPRNSAALLCGVKGMTESVKDLLSNAGVFEGRIMTNF